MRSPDFFQLDSSVHPCHFFREEAKSLALTFLDWDAVPVSGFPWIHWIAANIAPTVTEIPEDNSQTLKVPMVQGRNSTAGGIIGNKDVKTAWHYNGPNPPGKYFTKGHYIKIGYSRAKNVVNYEGIPYSEVPKNIQPKLANNQ